MTSTQHNTTQHRAIATSRIIITTTTTTRRPSLSLSLSLSHIAANGWKMESHVTSVQPHSCFFVFFLFFFFFITIQTPLSFTFLHHRPFAHFRCFFCNPLPSRPGSPLPGSESLVRST